MENFRTDLAMKLDADGNILICDGINIGLRIQNLTNHERLQLLPFLVRELAKDFDKEFVVKQLVAVMNKLLSSTELHIDRPLTPKLPLLAKGKIKTQEIENTGTGVVTQEVLVVELQDLVKMGRVGLAVRIQNMEKEEKLGLLKLLARDLKAERYRDG